LGHWRTYNITQSFVEGAKTKREKKRKKGIHHNITHNEVVMDFQSARATQAKNE
jgi:hypothetical protein